MRLLSNGRWIRAGARPAATCVGGASSGWLAPPAALRHKMGLHDKTELAMRARIYQPARNAMTSGQAKTRSWVLDYAPSSAREVDPLMGWTSSDDTQTQVRLRFGTKEEAMAYAEANGIDAEIGTPHKRKQNIRAMGYGENFATNRRAPWTH